VSESGKRVPAVDRETFKQARLYAVRTLQDCLAKLEQVVSDFKMLRRLRLLV
jgi:hypothetical protein